MQKPPNGSEFVVKSGVGPGYSCTKHQVYLTESNRLVYQDEDGYLQYLCLRCVYGQANDILELQERPKDTPLKRIKAERQEPWKAPQRVFSCHACMWTGTEEDKKDHDDNCPFKIDNRATCAMVHFGCDRNGVADCKECGETFCSDHLIWPAQLCLECMPANGNA